MEPESERTFTKRDARRSHGARKGSSALRFARSPPLSEYERRLLAAPQKDLLGNPARAALAGLQHSFVSRRPHEGRAALNKTCRGSATPEAEPSIPDFCRKRGRSCNGSL